MNIPDYIQRILEILKKHHAQAFLVGGCVRDMLMGRTLHDYDITSNALCEDMIQWFEDAGYKVIPTGLKHGTITVLTKQEPVEITTFRKEGNYRNHRSPDTVCFSSDIVEDLKRRDFTINAIAYDPALGWIDPYHGIDDIAKGIIRCVGNPMERFEEDALRILRAIRFSCTLNFTIEEDTWQSILLHHNDLRYISVERIKDEFNKILLGNRPYTLHYLRKACLLTQIIPEFADIYDHPQKTPWHIYDIFEHTDVALNHTSGMSLAVKLAIVFHDIGKAVCETFDEDGIAHYKGHAHVSMQIAQKRLRALHYDNKTVQHVCKLIQYHDYYLHPKPNLLRRYLSKFDNCLWDAFEALDVQIADNHAKNPERSQELLDNIDACKALMLKMEAEHDLVSMKDLAVNGYDVMAIGLKGKQIKEALQFLLDAVIEEPSINHKEILLRLLQEKKNAKSYE